MKAPRHRLATVGTTSAAFVLTVLLFGILLSVRGPRTAIPLPPPDAVRLRFLPVVEGSPAAATRDIWSPVMFSSAGESAFAPAREGAALLRPPLDPPDPAPLFLEAPLSHGGRVSASVPEGIASSRVALQRLYLPPVPAEPEPASPRWTLESPDGWDRASFDANPWPEDARADVAWEARVWFAADSRGWPREVLVEASSHPEVRAALARALRAWRLHPDSDRREGRLRIRFEPAGTQEEP